jgi:hypothetical protein
MMLNCSNQRDFLLIGLLAISITGHAVQEDIQIGLSQPNKTPIQWENLIEAPLWVKGMIPEFSSNWGLHQVTLEQPKDFVTVWLAEGQWLRLYNPDEPLPANALDIAVSYGTGLYASVPAQSAQQQHSLLLTPHLSQSRLVRIRLAAKQSEAVTMALFTSRPDSRYPIKSEQRDIPVSNQPVTLRFAYQTEEEQSIEQTFWYLSANQQVRFRKINGPAQLSVETRFIYPATEEVLQQAYRLKVQIDDQLRFLEFETTVDNQQPILIDGQPRVLGRSEMTYLKLSDGEHEIKIHSSTHLLVRLVWQEPKEQIQYVFPDHYQPLDIKPVEFHQFQQTFWPLSANTPVTVQLQGPAQLDLDSRLIYSSSKKQLPQTYRLRFGWNNNQKFSLFQQSDLLKFLEITTHLDNQSPIVINGQPQWLGQSKPLSLKIPAGQHQLQISSDANLYISLKSKSRHLIEQPGFLFPKLNQPPVEDISSGENLLPDWINKSSWRFTEKEIQTLYLTHFDSIEALRHIGLRLIRDNSRREGGLLGAMALREAARRRPYDAKVRRLANGLLGRHSFYRDLLPWHKSHKQSQHFHRFLVYRLREPNSKFRPLVVAEQHRQSYLKRIAGAYFAPIPVGRENDAQIYQLPNRTVPSFLHIVVKQQQQPQPQRFLLQFDNQPPIQMQQEPYVFEAPSHYYRYSSGDTALKMLALAHSTDADTLGGPFASRHTPGALVDASSFVLPLPPTVRQIKIWQTEAGGEPLYVALQYRAARRHYRLGETEYWEAVSHFGSSDALFDYFVSVLRRYKNSPHSSKSNEETAGLFEAQQDLYNYWLPFIRFLYAQRQHFLATVSESKDSVTVQSQSSGNNDELNRLVSQARQAKTEQQPLVALEKWTQVAQRSQGVLYRQAQMARQQTLEQLGETFLAKRLLQGLFLESTDPLLVQQAFQKLLATYQSSDNKAAALPLLATAVLTRPTPILYRQLTQALIDSGYQDYAFMVGMAMPKAERPNALMIEQAYRLGWWQTFETLLPVLPVQQQRLWRGYQAQDQGNYSAALKWWRQAGHQGKTLAQALKQGLHIRQQLQQLDDDRFEQQDIAIQQWERWQAEHPGPKHWISADDLISDYASGELTYSIERDLYFYSFISTPQRPVKLRIPGPLRIRLSVRTLHHKDNVEPLDGWAKIKKNGQLQVLRLNNILPSQGLRLIGQADQLLGHQTSEEYELGPGLHEVEVFSDQWPIAVKLKAERPRLPLAVLPPLDKDTLSVALMLQDDHFTNRSACQFVHSDYPNRGGQKTGTIEPLITENVDWNDNLSATNKTDENRLFSACRRVIPVADCQCLDCVMLIPHCLTFTSYNQYVDRNQLLILEHLRRRRVRANASAAGKAAHYLATDNLAAILALPVPKEESELVKRMTQLLWIAEQSPELMQPAVVAGAALFHQSPNIPELRSLWAALRQNHHWKTLSTVESSAGLRFVKIQGWQPESPSQRIRKSLLKPIRSDEQLITGHRQMGLSLFNLTETRLELKLQMDDVAYFRPVPMTVVYWLDEQPHQRLTLTPSHPSQTVRLTVPKGEHLVYVALDKPIANQFLRVQVNDIGRGNTPLILEYERAYQVATQQEPVIVNVLGPSWIRIDEWRSDDIYSYFKPVNPGWQKLTLKPRQGQTTALYRIHGLVPKTEQQPNVPFRYFNVVGEVMPNPVVQIYKLPPISDLEVKDAFPLAEQEEGSWSFTGLVQRRRNVEEEDSGFQDFIELRATHRYHDEINSRHHRTEGLIRLNEEMDLTLGARKRMRYRAEEQNLTLSLAGSAYLQQLRDNGLEWHGFAKGSLSQRWLLGDKTVSIPSVSLFGRLLSRDDLSDDYQYAARLDNDVYSDYKADHRYGLSIADQLTYRPWLDTLWTGRIALTSNETFYDPDYLSLKGVWKQMLGQGQLDLGYRFMHYWADDDRSRNYNRHFLLLDLNWNAWHSNKSRWEIGAKLQHDLDNNELFGMLYLSWHDGNGRAYRDFMPGEIDFLRLRKWQIPQDENNQIMRGEW